MYPRQPALTDEIRAYKSTLSKLPHPIACRSAPYPTLATHHPNKPQYLNFNESVPSLPVAGSHRSKAERLTASRRSRVGEVGGDARPEGRLGALLEALGFVWREPRSVVGQDAASSTLGHVSLVETGLQQLHLPNYYTPSISYHIKPREECRCKPPHSSFPQKCPECRHWSPRRTIV